MGSVVQVFTKRAGAAGVDAAPRATGAIEAGSFGSWRADAGIAGGAQGRVDYNATVSGRQTDGAFADILPEDDSFEQTAVTLGAGLALGPRASLRTGLRYSDGTSRNVGPINYGSRDTGGVYEADDLSWHIDGAHAIGAWYTGTAAFNYFRYDSLSADTNADPEFGTYTILEGTRDAIFPNGPRLVRTIDVTEFLSLAGGGALPAPGQFLAAAISFDYPFDSASAFRRPGFRYQGDARLGQRPAAERRVRMGTRVEPADRRPIPHEQRVLRPTAVHVPAIGGSRLSAAASTARRATTRSSARSCRRAASWCRSGVARCRR